MNKKFPILFTILLIVSSLTAQNKAAFQLYDAKGKAVSYEEMLKKMSSADLLFFGEQHNNPIAHWLELQLTKDIFALKKGNLQLGAEMFEADGQEILDEFLSGVILESNFEKEMRLWDNYKTDYKPLVSFAAAHNIPFFATNIPRRYASLVFREGLESLKNIAPTAQKWVAPQPIEIDYKLKIYKEMLGGTEAVHGAESLKFPAAQAIKDATMADKICHNYKPNKFFIHFNGAFHSDFQEGIIWYVRKQKPQLKIMNLTTLSQENIFQIADSELGRADFYLVTPDDMTTTY